MTAQALTLTSGTITALLKRIDSGESAAVEELFQSIYEDIRQAVQRQRPSAADRQLLQTTAIVNEVCLRLGGDGFRPSMTHRRHLFGSVNRAIRQVMIDHARKRQTEKRTGRQQELLEEYLARYEQACGHQILELDEALEALRALKPRTAEIVDARFWGGLTNDETAELLGISPDTVKRDWRFARAFLKSELDPAQD